MPQISSRTEDERIVIGAIKECPTRKSVHDLFGKYEIQNDEIKIELLRVAMGSPETFYSNERIITSSNKLERQISILLTGKWKLSKFFKRPSENEL